jgi:hypothetical protein
MLRACGLERWGTSNACATLRIRRDILTFARVLDNESMASTETIPFSGHIFISHSSDDLERALEVVELLERAGTHLSGSTAPVSVAVKGGLRSSSGRFVALHGLWSSARSERWVRGMFSGNSN